MSQNCLNAAFGTPYFSRLESSPLSSPCHRKLSAKNFDTEITENLTSSSTESESEINDDPEIPRKYKSGGPGYGYALLIGPRDAMEDSCDVDLTLLGAHYFLVLDGHVPPQHTTQNTN